MCLTEDVSILFPEREPPLPSLFIAGALDVFMPAKAEIWRRGGL